MRRLVLLVLLLTGCAAVPLAAPFDAKRLDEPDWYERLFDEMLECLDKLGANVQRRDYGGVIWYMTRPGVMGQYGEVEPMTGEVAGLWSWPNVVMMDARYFLLPRIARHELGHYILQAANEAHPLIALCEGE